MDFVLFTSSLILAMCVREREREYKSKTEELQRLKKNKINKQIKQRTENKKHE